MKIFKFKLFIFCSFILIATCFIYNKEVIAIDDYEFELMWPEIEHESWYFSIPTLFNTVAIDNNKNIFVINQKRDNEIDFEIKKFTPNGTFITSWNLKSDMMNSPTYIQTDNEGNIICVAGKLIQIFSNNGNLISEFSYNTYTELPLIYHWKTNQIQVDNNGNIFILIYNIQNDIGVYKINSIIQKFDQNGNIAFTLEKGSKNFEHIKMAISDSFIYVFDFTNKLIQKFDQKGNFLLNWGKCGAGDDEIDIDIVGSLHEDGYYSISYINIDKNEILYLIDKKNKRVQKFSSNGLFINSWNFNDPFQLDIDQYDNIYIGDRIYIDNKVDRYNELKTIYKISAETDVLSEVRSYRSWGRHCIEKENIYCFNSGMFASHIEIFSLSGEFINKIGSSGTENGYFDVPGSIANDNEGNIYVRDGSNDRIQKFDNNGNFITKLGSWGNGNGEFDSVIDIAIDIYNNIYVVDDRLKRVQKFTSNGDFITKWGIECELGDYCQLKGIAIDTDGNVFISNAQNRISVFNPNGIFLFNWILENTNSLTLDDLSIDNNGNLYTIDKSNYNNKRILHFNMEGMLVNNWDCDTLFENQIYLSCLVNDIEGNIFFSADSEIYKMSPNGKIISKIEIPENIKGLHLKYIYYLTVDHIGNIFVCDNANNRILKFRPTQQKNQISLIQHGLLTEGVDKQIGKIVLHITPNSDTVINLFSSDHSEVNIPETITIPQGENSANFDLTVVDDDIVDGTQTVTITASAAGFTSASAIIKIQDNDHNYFFESLEIPENAIEGDNILSKVGKITLNKNVDKNIVISLSSDDLSEVSVPDSVIILANEQFVTFDITVIDDEIVDGTSTATITAKLSDMDSISAIINIQDNDIKNDHHPTINEQAFSIDENNAENVQVGRVSANDLDNNSLFFNIINNYDIFTISNDSGIIFIEDSNKLDYEIQSTYSLTVQVSDGKYTDSALIIISVNNLNDNTPIINDQTFSIEHSRPNESIVGIVEAYDADNNSLIFSIIKGNTNNSFSIDSNVGKITIKDSSQFQNSNIYNLTVQVTDGKYNSTANIQINITPNQPPNKPNINFPQNGATISSLTPNLYLKEFLDSNGDEHLKTQWMVSKDMTFSESSLVINTTSNSSLTSLKINQFILNENFTYYWKVRFFDSYNGISEWSDQYSFITPEINKDDNKNGIPDNQEVKESVDLDNNGIDDRNQSDIKCLKTYEDKAQIGIKSIKNVESVISIDPEVISNVNNKPENLPMGLILFKINCSYGEKVNVTIYFDNPIPASAKWYKYDPSLSKGWYDYSNHSSISADRKSILLELKDGSYGDIDNLENGIIVDPSGYGLYTEPLPQPNKVSGDDGGGGGCFINALY